MMCFMFCLLRTDDICSVTMNMLHVTMFHAHDIMNPELMLGRMVIRTTSHPFITVEIWFL
jgi:hypothetical protein